ncbi:hypothetical protein TWF192_005738 [Orbilia oligospora]|nr:hypothetical protein TWF192_005738 [Orbilia oligospora]
MSWSVAAAGPPIIPKPSRDSKSGEQFGPDFIHKQFKIPYYEQMTGNWERIKFKAVILVLKRLCEPAVKAESLVPYCRLEMQDEEVIARIYNTFQSAIKSDRELPQEFRRVLEDLMTSTEGDKWLFFWIVAQIRDKWKRRRSKADMTYGEGAAGQHVPTNGRRAFDITDQL